MDQEKLEDVLDKIMRRGDPAYNSPSGAFLEYLSNLATQLDLVTFADACACYTAVYPESSAFIAGRVPGILCNRYFTVLPGFNYGKFIRWSVATHDWASQLKTGFNSSVLLKSAVASICTNVEADA